MDPSNLDKWKQDFSRKQEDLMQKAKDIQKQTLNRRKTMEMKARLEAAKEEKRRQEALAERRAHHVEATMRFQKGFKHFKFNKERISLEQVLRDIKPPPTPSQTNRVNSADHHYQTSHNNNSQVKKTSSHDNLHSATTTTTTTPANMMIQNTRRVKKTTATPIGNKPIINNHQQSFNPYKNPDFLSDNSNNDFYSTINNGPNVYIADFKEILEENQKNIQNNNTEALQEFQNLVTDELTIENNINGGININDENLKGKKNNLENNYIAYESDDKLYKTDLKDKSRSPSLSDESDSMETDSLINENIVVTHYGPTGNNDTNNERNTNDSESTGMQKSFYYKYYNKEKKIQDSSMWFKNMENIQLSNNIGNNYKPPPKAFNDSTDNDRPKVTFNENNAHKEVKGILKRTSSFDNDLSNIGFTPVVNFGIDRTNVKDSLAVANQRMNKTNKPDENGEKKNVRFAANLTSETPQSTNEPIKPTPAARQTNNNQQAEVSLNNTHAKMIQSLLEKPNPSDHRINSTNSTRRPMIRTRTLQPPHKKGEMNSHSNLVNDKPPAHPNSTSPAANPSFHAHNGSYALLGQRRKDQVIQRNKQQTITTRLNSPKQTPSSTNIKIDLTNGIHHYSNVTSTPHSPAATTGTNGFVLPLNRAPIQSPIQSPSPYFPMPINSCPTTPVSANNNSNSNYNNLKYTENNYRDFQRAVKTDGVNSAPTTPSVTLPMFNVFEKNKSQTKLNFTNADSDISSVISNTTPAVNKNLTKIPLSPKSTLGKHSSSYLNNTADSTTSDIVRRPNSMPNTMTNFTSNYGNNTKSHGNLNATPTATPLTNNNNNSNGSLPGSYQQVPKANIRFAYLNSTVNNNSNGAVVNTQLTTPPKKVPSADNLIKIGPSQSPQSHLNSFPLFSNYSQIQYNNSKQCENSGTANPTDSLAAFLKAEEMSTNECTESQILDTVDAFRGLNTKNMPMTLSIEEQKVQNSIMRLNERLNVINSNRRFSNVSNDDNNNKLGMQSYRNSKPMISNTAAKSRR